MHRIEAYVTLGLIIIAIISIFYLPILLILKKRGVAIIRQLSYLALFCSVFLIIFGTILFMPFTFNPSRYVLNLRLFDWSNKVNPAKMFVEEVIPNIMMFVPLGFFVPIVFAKMRKLYRTAIVAFAVTFSVEFFQYFIGRSCDIDDILANFFGGVLGYLIFSVFHSLLKRRKWWKKFIGNKSVA